MICCDVKLVEVNNEGRMEGMINLDETLVFFDENPALTSSSYR
jgi:hypothetical protein